MDETLQHMTIAELCTRFVENLDENSLSSNVDAGAGVVDKPVPMYIEPIGKTVIMTDRDYNNLRNWLIDEFDVYIIMLKISSMEKTLHIVCRDHSAVSKYLFCRIINLYSDSTSVTIETNSNLEQLIEIAHGAEWTDAVASTAAKLGVPRYM